MRIAHGIEEGVEHVIDWLKEPLNQWVTGSWLAEQAKTNPVPWEGEETWEAEP